MEIIDIDRLKSLFDAFYAAMGISTVIVSLDEEILIESGWQRICADFHRHHPEARNVCIQSNASAHKNLISPDSQAIFECPHGLIDAATPIVIGGRTVAYLHAGQFLFAAPDETTVQGFRDRGAKWEFEEHAYLEALQEVPVISEKRASFILQYLKAFAEMIGEVGLSRLRLFKGERTIAKAHDALKKEVKRRWAEAKKLNQILEGTPIPTFVIDADHKVTHWNRACALLTDIPAADIVGTDRQRDVFYPRRRDVLADIILEKGSIHKLARHYGNKFRSARLIKDGYEVEDFFPHFGKNGRWFFFTATLLKDAAGKVVGAIETIQDVTDRHIAEQGLRASEARYRQLFESANDALFVLKDTLLVDCNRKGLDLFHTTREKMMGLSPESFSPETQPDGSLSADEIRRRYALAMEGVEQFFEWRFIEKDGSPFDAEVSITRSMIDGAPHLLAIVRDISDRKRMIQALREREKELDEKSRYLERVNQALKASLDNREVEKRAVEENMLVNLKRFVFPYLETLGKCDIGTEARAYLNIIETNLNDIVSQFSRTIFSKYIDFTPTEVRIADFIREGKNSKEIANMLGLSPSSIQWHRKNIREKLGLTNKKVNLHTYLNTLSR